MASVNTRRLIIAIDCDDVLVHTTPFFVEAYNSKYGTNVQLVEAHTESYEAWNADRPLLEERLALLMDTDAYRLLAPTESAIRVLKDLAKDHELHVVTARREHERGFTQAMLDRELAGVFASMEFVGFTGSKGEVCRRIGADVLIDDNSRHLHDAIKTGLSPNGALLFGDYAWNTTDKSSVDLKHLVSWDEVKEVLDEIANEQ
ncbi:MAG: 5' nucleotidase, NT5C type [Candidatus Saccharimonadaceae bacterium]